MNAVIDTAAEVSVVNRKLVNNLLGEYQPMPARLWGIGSQDIQAEFYKNIPVILGDRDYKAPLYVADITDDMLLGIDFFDQFGVVIDFARCELHVQGDVIQAHIVRDTKRKLHAVSRVTTNHKIRLEPQTVSRMKIPVEQEQKETFLFSPAPDASESLMPCTFNSKGKNAVAQFVNDTSNAIFVEKGTVLGTAVAAGILNGPRPGHRRIRRLTRTAERMKLSKLPPHIQDCYEKSKNHLEGDDSKLKHFQDLLLDFKSGFAEHDMDLGHFTALTHTIPLVENAQPFRDKIRRTPVSFEKEEEKTLNSMLEAGVIQPSTSPWASAPVLVRKKEGGVRWCIDFRHLNDLTVKDQYPLPLISSCYDTLQGNMYMSTLDLAAGYWQIDIAPEDREKTAFITKYGLYEHRRMSMGLCNAPSTFQRAMNLVLRGLTWKTVLAFLDDILVLGKSFEDHLKNLREVLERLQHYNLKLKPRKCIFFQKQTKFLGRIVSGESVSVDPTSLEPVASWPIPRCTREVESFLGFANYNREHVPKLAELAEPLYGLTGKNKFKWEDKHTEAFNAIKQALLNPVELMLPTPDGAFVLDVDASNVAVAAQLSQIRDGKEVPVSYGSKSLTPQQRRYCATRKELLALVVFTRQFRHYLLGRPFTVRTDHNSLVWLTHFKNLQGQLARWLEELQQYSMQICHRRGRDHLDADILTRIRDDVPYCDCYRAAEDITLLPCKGCKYCEQWNEFENEVDDVEPLSIPTVRVTQVNHEWADILNPHLRKEKQNMDHDLVLLKEWLQDPPNDETLAAESPELKTLWNHRQQIVLENDILWYNWIQDGTERKLFIIPSAMKSIVLNLAHDNSLAGHFGREKTYERIARNFYWPGMRRDIEEHVRGCYACNRSKHLRRKYRAPLKEYTMGAPLEKLHVDIMGPLPKTARQNTCVLVLVDQFSKWVELVALPDQQADTVAQALIDVMISRLGCPNEIFSDQGSNFCSSLFEELCERLGITKKRTTGYRASANGQAERVNRVLGQAIRSILASTVKAHQSTWDIKLQMIAGAIRCTVNRNTGYTPNKIMLGREVVQPLELMCGVPNEPQAVSDFVKQLQIDMKEIHETTRKALKMSQRRQKLDYDLRKNVSRYQEGDAVLLINSATKIGHSKKLQPIWLGPFLVTKVISSTLYQIASQKKTFVVHHDRIRPCLDKTLPLWFQRRRRNFEGGEDILDQTLGPLVDAPIWCYCRKPDNGSLMIMCDGCGEWFHTKKCLKLSKKQVDKIDVFLCRDCK